MPADYSSTAEALSVPLIPESDESTSPTFEPVRAPWSQPRSSLSSRPRRRSSLFSVPDPTWRDRVINNARHSWRRWNDMYERMTILQKILFVLGSLAAGALGIGFLILTGQIFKWIEPVAEDWEKAPLAYFVIWMLTFTVSFPPLVGWSTIGTVSGFVFGVWKGWATFATATVIGSTCSFILSRTVLSSFVHRLMEHDKRFAALALTLKYDGLKLLCMIRLCPLPYSICNGAISTFPTVHPLMYGLATAIISPKLLVPVFIGSRLRILTQNGESMSAGSKAVNVISIIVSIAVGVFTGWYIYRSTLARAKQLEDEERASIRQGLQSDAQHLQPPAAFSDDPEERAAAGILARDEEERIGFRDGQVDGNDDDDRIAIDPVTYRDEFTDDDSDVFDDGDGGDDVTEAYSLHRRVDSK